MENLDRVSVKKLILEKYSKKVKKDVLKKNIEGLVDEYIEHQKFIIENGDDCTSLPTKEEMKWWFQEKAEVEEKEVDGKIENLLEIGIDTICLNDRLAQEVFTHLYTYKWKQGDEIDPLVQQFIKINILAEESSNKPMRMKAKSRLANISLVGVIRFYHLERKPYLTQSEVNIAINYFRKVLFIIDKVNSGEYKNKTLDGEMHLFSAFKK